MNDPKSLQNLKPGCRVLETLATGHKLSVPTPPGTEPNVSKPFLLSNGKSFLHFVLGLGVLVIVFSHVEKLCFFQISISEPPNTNGPRGPEVQQVHAPHLLPVTHFALVHILTCPQQGENDVNDQGPSTQLCCHSQLLPVHFSCFLNCFLDAYHLVTHWLISVTHTWEDMTHLLAQRPE